MKRCKHCHKILDSEKKNFCSKKCCENWKYKHIPRIRKRKREIANKWYEKNKDDKEYKRKSKERLQKWVENNREEHNAYMRKYMRKRWKKYYKYKKSAKNGK